RGSRGAGPPDDLHHHPPTEPRRRVSPVDRRSHRRLMKESTMTQLTVATTIDAVPVALPVEAGDESVRLGAALWTLIRRRAALSVHTPRELFVPLMTPVLFALVIAPALDSIGPKVPGLDYLSFAAVGTAVLLIPLNCMFAGV